MMTRTELTKSIELLTSDLMYFKTFGGCEFTDSSYVKSINSYLGVDASNRRICLDVPLATGGYGSHFIHQ